MDPVAAHCYLKHLGTAFLSIAETVVNFWLVTAVLQRYVFTVLNVFFFQSDLIFFVNLFVLMYKGNVFLSVAENSILLRLQDLSWISAVRNLSNEQEKKNHYFNIM